MEHISRQQLFEKKSIDEGVVFLYPTDTVYGLGGNAYHERTARRIRTIKQRDEKPFSVIVPSLDWIHKHCIVPDTAIPWLKKLPGPYTFVFQLKSDVPCPLARSVTNIDTIGIRIPDHWSSQLASALRVPIISTSANISGQPPFASLPPMLPLLQQVDFVIDEGTLPGTPSPLVLFTETPPKLITR